MPIERAQITGLILAGGRGQRMGGRDKGLQPFQGEPLAAHVLRRLQPQVGRVLISANRHADAYAALGAPVIGDTLADFPGPLAGMLAGLQAIETDYLLTVPCDSPYLADDLAVRLADALAGQAPTPMEPPSPLNTAESPSASSASSASSAASAPAALPTSRAAQPGDAATNDRSTSSANTAWPRLAAYAATAGGPHPVFALLHRSLANDLAQALAGGERRVRAWLARHNAVQVRFDDERPFYNINTLDDLHIDTPRDA